MINGGIERGFSVSSQGENVAFGCPERQRFSNERRLTDDGSKGCLSSFSLTDGLLIYFYLSLNLYVSHCAIATGRMD